MKTFLKLIAGAFALVISTFALADGGVVSSVEGTATVQTGTGAPRTLRLGDAVAEGDTLATGPNSTLIVRFDDGQVVGLSARAKLTIDTYKYNPTAKSGNILISLVDGGMRALTGLIGKANPEAVTYKARTATIGIRGTHVGMEYGGANNLSLGVLEGIIGFNSVVIGNGQGVNFNFSFPTAINVVPLSQVNFSPGFQQFLNKPISGVSNSQGATQPGENPNTTTTNTPGTAGPAGSGGGGATTGRPSGS